MGCALGLLQQPRQHEYQFGDMGDPSGRFRRQRWHADRQRYNPSPQVTETGRSGFGFIEFMVQVNDLDVHLDPGTYWLNVTPVDNLDGGRSFDSTTSGASCVGTPCGDNDTAFLDSTLFGAFFEPVIDFGDFSDFSMGVNGEVSGGGGGITLGANVHHKMVIHVLN